LIIQILVIRYCLEFSASNLGFLSRMSTIKQSLLQAVNKLKKTSESPWLDAEVLLAYALKINKTKLYARSEKVLTKNKYQSFQRLIARRLKNEPVAYITHHKEFFGLDFYVDKNVLIPRPETELLIEETLKQSSINKKRLTIVDVGTGSGCIAISIAKNISHFLTTKIYATDISKRALQIARKNAKRHKVFSKIKFLYGNLLKPLPISLFKKKQNFIIVANLPYLTTREWQKTTPEIKKYEPRFALDGGKNGLFYFEELFQQIRSNKFVLNSLKFVTLEIGAKQGPKIKKLTKKYFPKSTFIIKKDLAELDRTAVVDL